MASLPGLLDLDRINGVEAGGVGVRHGRESRDGNIKATSFTLAKMSNQMNTTRKAY